MRKTFFWISWIFACENETRFRVAHFTPYHWIVDGEETDEDLWFNYEGDVINVNNSTQDDVRPGLLKDWPVSCSVCCCSPPGHTHNGGLVAAHVYLVDGDHDYVYLAKMGRHCNSQAYLSPETHKYKGLVFQTAISRGGSSSSSDSDDVVHIDEPDAQYNILGRLVRILSGGLTHEVFKFQIHFIFSPYWKCPPQHIHRRLTTLHNTPRSRPALGERSPPPPPLLNKFSKSLKPSLSIMKTEPPCWPKTKWQ